MAGGKANEAPKQYEGVAVYEILKDGCLNGVFSDNHPDTENRIYNEIMKKSDGKNSVDGSYDTGWFDVNGLNSDRVVRVTAGVNRRGHFHFEWFDENNKPLFEGSGWQTRDNQIVVSYRNIL